MILPQSEAHGGGGPGKPVEGSATGRVRAAAPSTPSGSPSPASRVRIY